MTKKEYNDLSKQIDALKLELKGYDMDDRFNDPQLYWEKQKLLNKLRRARDEYKPRKRVKKDEI